MAQTKIDLSDNKVEQLSNEILHLSGCTYTYGQFAFQSGSTLSILPNHGTGKVLTSNSGGTATWQVIPTVVVPITGATNGLSVTGKKIKLGGALTGNTTINILTSNLYLCSSTNINRGISLNQTGNELKLSWGDATSACTASISVNDLNVSLSSVYSGGGCAAGLEITHVDNRICFSSTGSNKTYHDNRGFHYVCDYSGGANSRWLPDKGYVDSKTSGNTFTESGSTVITQNGIDVNIFTPIIDVSHFITGGTNGLTTHSHSIGFGGTLTGNTTINVDSGNLTISGTSVNSRPFGIEVGNNLIGIGDSFNCISGKAYIQVSNSNLLKAIEMIASTENNQQFSSLSVHDEMIAFQNTDTRYGQYHTANFSTGTGYLMFGADDGLGNGKEVQLSPANALAYMDDYAAAMNSNGLTLVTADWVNQRIFTGATGFYTLQTEFVTLTGTTLPNNYATKIHFNSHTGDTTIHFKQSGITITESQVTGLITSLAGKLASGGTALCATTAGNALCVNGHTEGNLSVNNSACLNTHTEGNLSVNNSVCLNGHPQAYYLLSGATAICATTAGNSLCLNGHTEAALSVCNSVCVNGHSEANLSVANSACLGGHLPAYYLTSGGTAVCAITAGNALCLGGVLSAGYLLSGGTAKNSLCLNGHTEAALSVCNSVCVNGHAEAALSVCNAVCVNGHAEAALSVCCAQNSANLGGHLPAYYLASGGTAICATTAGNSLCLGGVLPAGYLLSGGTAKNSLCLNGHTEAALSVCNSVCVNGHAEAALNVCNAVCVNGHAEANLSVANSACLGGVLPAGYLLSGGTAKNSLCLGGNLANTYAPLANPNFTTCTCAPIVCATTCFVGSGAGLTGTAASLKSNDSSCLNGVLAAGYLLSGGTAKNSLCLGGNLANTYAPIASPNFTTNACAPIFLGSTCVCGAIVCSNTCILAGTCVTGTVACFSSCVRSPLISGGTICGSTAVYGLKIYENGTCLGSTYLAIGGCACDSKCLGGHLPAYFLTSGGTAVCATTAGNALCLNGHTEGNLSVNNSACVNGHTEAALNVCNAVCVNGHAESALSVANSACLGGHLPAYFLTSGGTAVCATTAGNALCVNGHTEAALSVCNSVCVNGHAEANLVVATANNATCLGGHLPAYYLLSGGTAVCSTTAGNALCLGGSLAACYATKALAVTGITSMGAGTTLVHGTPVSGNKVQIKSLTACGTGLSIVSDATTVSISGNTTDIFANVTDTYLLQRSGSTIAGYSLANITTQQTRFSVTQASHGFIVGNVIKSNGANTYVKATGNTAANSEVVGIVTVRDTNTFTFVTHGIIETGVPVQTAGTVMFLSPTSGGTLTTTEPTTAGQVSKPLMVVLQSGSKALFQIFRGLQISPFSGYTSQQNRFTVSQTSHGLSVGNVIKPNGINVYVKATGNTAANAEVVGIVTIINDANTFTYVTQGIIETGVPVQTAGTVMFLSPTSGGTLTITEPTTIGQISKPLLVVLQSGVRALFQIFRGLVITADGSYATFNGTEILTNKTLISPIISGNTTLSGYVTNTKQPAFLAYKSGNTAGVTGDATIYSIIFDNKFYDRTSNYNKTTGVFTAPVSGIYLLTTAVRVNGLSTVITDIIGTIVYTQGTFRFNDYSPAGANIFQYRQFAISGLACMNAGDTAYVTTQECGSASKIVGVTGNNANTYFSGHLVF